LYYQLVIACSKYLLLAQCPLANCQLGIYMSLLTFKADAGTFTTHYISKLSVASRMNILISDQWLQQQTVFIA